jgi:hypothetical protein
MDVAVHYKRQQRRLRSAPRASVLGEGLLERARSTSLALLGLTAAVGLAMVALALNQGWPLIAGAPIPGFGGKQQAVGDATVAAAARVPSSHGAAPRSIAARQGSSASTHPTRNGVGGAPAPGPQSLGSEGVVVSDPTPVNPPGDVPPSAEGSPDSGPPGPLPVAQQPATTPAPASEPAPSSAAPSASPAPQPTSESPTPAQATLVSNASGGHGHGHHSGRGASGGYGHSTSRNDSDASESNEAPEPAPSLPVEPPADSNATEESESQSSPPTWGHDGDHDYGHSYGHDRHHW